MNEAFTQKTTGKIDVVSVDFANADTARETITEWAASKTKSGLDLKDLNFPASTKIALTSAMYYKDSWTYTFHPAGPRTFKTPTGDKTVDMMFMKKKFKSGNLGDYARWVAVPYESDDSLIIILPHENSTVDKVINQMDEQTFNQIMLDLDGDDTLVRKYLSKDLTTFFKFAAFFNRPTSTLQCQSSSLKAP